MTRKHIKINKSVDSILEIVENLKTKIKDGEYKKILDKLKVIHDNNEEEKYKKYLIHIMLVSIDKTTELRKDDKYDNDDECFFGLYDYQPIIETIKKNVRMKKTDYAIIQQKLEGSIAGIRYIHGLSSCNPIDALLDSLVGYGSPALYETTNISTYEQKNISINTKLLKSVRLMSIKEVDE